MTLKEEALAKHYEWKGKIEVISRTPVKSIHLRMIFIIALAVRVKMRYTISI